LPTEAVRPTAVDALLGVSAPVSVESLVWALGRTYDARVLPRLLDFHADPDKAVRLAVIIGGERCDYLIDQLIDTGGGDLDLAVASVVAAAPGSVQGHD
jgi:hypothetical protein